MRLAGEKDDCREARVSQDSVARSMGESDISSFATSGATYD